MLAATEATAETGGASRMKPTRITEGIPVKRQSGLHLCHMAIDTVITGKSCYFRGLK
jgi:hypothetical protein